ncbi:MAG: hypothetical protein WD768_03090 [Phycisphaeraceae bacterium]
MLVEHTFVTTLEWKEVIQQLVDPMEQMGFRWEVQCAVCGYDVRGSLREGRTLCSECGKPAPLVFTYGKKSPGKAKGISDCPQRIQIDFDRGRIMIGAALTPRGKAKGPHGHLMTDLVRGLEHFLIGGIPFDEAFRKWKHNSVIFDEEAKRKRRQGCTIAIVIVFGLIGLIILIAVLASGNRRGRFGSGGWLEPRLCEAPATGRTGYFGPGLGRTPAPATGRMLDSDDGCNAPRWYPVIRPSQV